MMMRFRVLLGAVMLATLIGCGGGDGPKLYSVSGTITFDGTPLDDGIILFRNTEADGKGYSGPISQGKYQVECEAGKMRVEIEAYKVLPGKFDTSNGEKTPIRKMFVPAKYNASTTLNANVPEKTTFDFTLTSK
ncbi:hypothetical protein [Tuwongella immobilis]|uniref:Carboxypeptidase regulatory-like domain-containing protein n=1 Tax=Tuwongella immobilis TaxID=692036 RepID=A0A6C2YIR6_9BACT|nr:hypothetical protein [Tuwongella immobilis]VIP00872.1 Putative uncharacterized protein OS=Rhodopirellula baltica (strain SH1) GN=RB8529 PE=4 SV=1 [Tuwongella immobilis]VTR97162.1 Putative uncharacterized protein OS=Rhodopirellula baltica (strain SH1) GN=RB8529 PE=4 SV=1 [Tuwongella immobilis]